ncbi:MAG: hypothetical protein GY749_48405 [Desulfobacteraceae bacterium]|nr:hypothetical protein [Desulfobacteraceae bacterium]
MGNLFHPFPNVSRSKTPADSLKIPLVLVPMLRVGMQGAALRADISKAKFVRQISVPNHIRFLIIAKFEQRVNV